MKRGIVIVLVVLVFFFAFYNRPKKQLSVHMKPVTQSSAATNLFLTEARRNFKTVLLRHESEHFPVETPPAKLFRTVHCDSPIGPAAGITFTQQELSSLGK